VLGAFLSEHDGGLLSRHFAGVPVAVVPSEQRVGLVPPVHVGILPSAHFLAPISLVTLEILSTAAFPSAQVLGYLPSLHAGCLPSEHFGGFCE